VEGQQGCSWRDHLIKDALTYDLLCVLAGVKSLDLMLFNSKFVTADAYARRPDVYFGSNVHCYMKCVLTKANSESYHRDAEKHMLRFLPRQEGEAYYQTQNADFVLLHFQDWGDAPIQLREDECIECLNE